MSIENTNPETDAQASAEPSTDLDYLDLLEGEEPEKDQDAADTAPEEETDEESDGTGDGEEGEEGAETQQALGAQIEIDGVKYTADEIKESMMLRADYTQKTQEIAHQVRAYEAEVRQATAVANEQAISYAAAVFGQLDSLLGLNYSPQDLMNLAQHDPHQAMQIQTKQEALKAIKQNLQREAQSMFARVQQERDVIAGQQDQMAQQSIQKAAQELRQEKWFTAEWVRQAQSFGGKHGFSAEEINNLGHSGALKIIRKAMLWDDAQNRIKSGKTAPIPKPTIPGATPNQGAASRKQIAEKAYAVARKTGDRKATHMAYASLLGD